MKTTIKFIHQTQQQILVVWNLLLNGAESIEGEGTLDLTVKTIKNKWVTVGISDSGCGMDDKTIQAIFNPFFTTKIKGSGLGLAIVKKLGYEAIIVDEAGRVASTKGISLQER